MRQRDDPPGCAGRLDVIGRSWKDSAIAASARLGTRENSCLVNGPDGERTSEAGGTRRLADIPPRGGWILTRTLMIEPAARAAGTGRPRADTGPQVEFHSRKETSMTRRETRKTRPERRARIGTECLESRNLLSGLGSTPTAQLVSVPPSIPHQTSLLGATRPIAELKYTFETPKGGSQSLRTTLQGANQNGGGAQDVTKISGSFQSSLWSGTGSDTYMKITGPRESVAYFKQDEVQTTLWSGTGQDTYMKITGPRESVAHFKQDEAHTVVSGASGPVAEMKITGPDVIPQTSPSAATNSFNFG
jgi:hypothetical protein